MSKFATAKPRGATSPITTLSVTPDTHTHEGGPAYTRDAKSELFLLAVTNMVSEDTFYEKADARDARFEGLVHQVAVEDPAWTASFIPWLRDSANMRSAAVVAACEYVKAGAPNGRAVINGACVRADEPAEIVGYWLSRYGRALPMPLKRGVADACARLYTERNFLKYDSQRSGVRWADVIELCHARPMKPFRTEESGEVQVVHSRQPELFKYVLDDRHHGDGSTEGLGLLRADAELLALPEDQRRDWLRANSGAFILRQWSWERLAGWLPGGMDSEAWEAIIPSMGAFALVRNLRNFDEAKVSKTARDVVTSKLTDPAEVQRSRMFPFRMYQAWMAVSSTHWGEALEEAVNLSIRNIPMLRGSTWIGLDVSGSMGSPMSKRSQLQRWQAAGVFAGALAQRCDAATIVLFGTDWARVTGAYSVLRFVDGVGERVDRHVYGRGARHETLGSGTNGWGALDATGAGFDRALFVTDGQFSDRPTPVAETIPFIYHWDVAGYRPGLLPGGGKGRHTFGGLNDAAFRMVPLLETRADGRWPWE